MGGPMDMILVMKVGATPITVPGYMLLGVVLLVWIAAAVARPDAISVKLKKED